jgi:hypothetical protein
MHPYRLMSVVPTPRPRRRFYLRQWFPVAVQNELWVNLSILLLLLAMFCAFLAGLVACGASAAQTDAARAGYADELQMCVHDAGTRADADACRAGVDRRYGVDAGLWGAK